MSIVQRIKELCKMERSTLAALERYLGFSQGSMRKWDESFPSADKVQKVAEHFKVSVDYILGRETDNTNLRFALLDGDGELTDAQIAEVKKFAQFIKERDKIDNG